MATWTSSAFLREELCWPPLPLPGCLCIWRKRLRVCVWLHVCEQRRNRKRCMLVQCVCAVWLCACRVLMLTFKLRVGYKRELLWSGWIVWEKGFDGGDGVGRVEEGGVLQWCLNVCESDLSNEGVTEAMNESACLCGSVGSLLTLFSVFCLCKGSSCSTHGCAWLKDKSCVRGEEVEHTTSETKTVCSPCGSLLKVLQ